MLQRPNDRRLWIGCLVTTSIGWYLSWAALVAGAIATVDSGDTLPLLPRDLVDFISTYSMLWAIIASIQAMLLRGSIGQSLWWIPRWIISSALGWAGFWLLVYMGRSELAILGASLLGALGLGILQWCVLRDYLGHAGWWIVVNVGGVGAVAVILWVANQIVFQLFGGTSLWFSLTLLLPGILFGALTGSALVVLCQRVGITEVSASAH